MDLNEIIALVKKTKVFFGNREKASHVKVKYWRIMSHR